MFHTSCRHDIDLSSRTPQARWLASCECICRLRERNKQNRFADRKNLRSLQSGVIVCYSVIRNVKVKSQIILPIEKIVRINKSVICVIRAVSRRYSLHESTDCCTTYGFLISFMFLTSKRIEPRTVGRTGKNLNQIGCTEVEIICRYLPEETENTHENLYNSLSDTPFNIAKPHH